MKSAKFASNIIDVAPKKLAKVKFLNGEVIEPGSEFVVHNLTKPPIVTWDFKPGELYTLILVNADATKSKQKFTQTEICRWLIVNIPENHIHKGQTINNYTAPQQGAALECELERYILLIFKQNSFINAADKFIFEINKEGCIFVQSTDYITMNNLGKLIAGNYFKIKF